MVRKKSMKRKKVVRKGKVFKKNIKKKARKRSVRSAVKKKSEKGVSKRVFTGIPNFDRLIEGGFEKNTTNLVVGGSGLGKTIFATQFLVSGMKKGEKCLYVTFEEKKEQFYSNMKDFGWDLQEYEKKGLFNFLEYTPIKVKTMLEEGGGEIESIILKNKISRMVIDSITSFELLFENELSKREAALSLFGMLRGWDTTTLLTLEESVSEGRTASKTMEFESDSIVLLYFVKGKAGRERRIEVVKMRGTKHSQRIYSFDVGKSGVNVSKNPVSAGKAI